MRTTLAIPLAAIALLVGCGSGNSTTPTNIDASTVIVTATAGDDQGGLAGLALPVRLQVVVTDTTGTPLAGQSVTWSGLDGAQALPTKSVSDAHGLAATTLVLGTVERHQGATATIDDGVGTTFTETAIDVAAMSRVVTGPNR